MSKELGKVYDPTSAESDIYAKWLEKGYFHAVVDSSKKSYCISMPPPNITSQLHVGHALDNTLQDILIRTKRMQGYSVLWQPGTDHASIATEAKIVNALKGEGVTKYDLGRDKFLERAWEWRKEYGGRIVEQLKTIGSSCDWERERFTLDEGCSRAVVEVFCRLYEKGLIYRAERIINWCPHCKTSISDAEVEYEEQDGFFWHIKYPLTDGSGNLVLATTRPETLLGDTAVAVNPKDERYSAYVGKTVTLPLVGREIPVVADDYVDMEFGTGVVKITPAHDPNDYEVGMRHSLPFIDIFNEDATVNSNGGKYEGMTREAARKAVLADLEKSGQLVKTEPHVHNVGTCYRCDTVIEPRLSMQWFVKMKPLAEPAIKAVRDGEMKFVPERFEKIYFNWMENIRDWCISRQLWWGHRIPAWYCSCGEIIVSRKKPDKCPKCGGALIQDEDTLDTWFSSALWPFSTLGWPDKTPELEYFYPTDTLVTAYDIIFFWVARMIFSGIENMHAVPFKTAFIHGLIRDSEGRKMSKSLGNGVDPLVIIKEYGADAMRMALSIGVSPGNDMRFSEEKIKAYRNFCNKLWNASRFVLMNGVDDVEPNSLPSALRIEDKWLLSSLQTLISEVTENIDRFELGIAAQKVYDFVWDVYCDWFIEIAKLRLSDENEAGNVKQVLVYALTVLLKLLHPFMPFITEQIYCALPNDSESIMISSYPVFDASLRFPKEEEDFGKVMELIKKVRALRAEMNVPPSKKTHAYIETQEKAVFESCTDVICKLASCSSIEVCESCSAENSAVALTSSARAIIPMNELVDADKERARLNKEFSACEKEINSLTERLANEQFTSRAPAAVVEGEKEKLRKALDKRQNIEQSLAALA